MATQKIKIENILSRAKHSYQDLGLKRGFTPSVLRDTSKVFVRKSPKVGSNVNRVAPSERMGFTLLETVVAFGIILAAVAGPVSLVINAFGTFGTSKNKLVAANLAEEGVELVRLIRDNNVLCDYVRKQINPATPEWRWNYRPDNAAGEGIADAEYSIAANSLAPLAAVNCGTIQSPSLSAFTGQKLQLAGSFYGAGPGTETIFERKVKITFTPPDADSGAPTADQVNIISTVIWSERTGTREVILKDRLYNWR